MKKEIKKLLEFEIERELKDLEILSTNSEEYKNTAVSVEKLIRLEIEEEEKSARRRADERQRKRDNAFQLAKLGLELTGIILPLACYDNWFGEGLEYEKTGAIASSMVRGLLNRIRPTR